MKFVKNYAGYLIGGILGGLFFASLFLIQPPFDHLRSFAVALVVMIGTLTLPTGLVGILLNYMQNRKSVKENYSGDV
jgi:hypothetical protein